MPHRLENKFVGLFIVLATISEVPELKNPKNYCPDECFVV